MVSAGPEPDLSRRRHASVQLVVHVAVEFVVVLVLHLVPGIGGVTPPAIQQESEEEWVDEAGVETVRVDVEQAVALERRGRAPQQSVRRQVAHLRHQSRDVAGHLDIHERHFPRELLHVLESAVVDFGELRTLLVELDIEEGVLAGEVEGVVGVGAGVGGEGDGVVVLALRSVFGVVLVMLVVLVVVVMALLAHK